MRIRAFVTALLLSTITATSVGAATIHYGAFGNVSLTGMPQAPDCEYVAAANLELHEYPTAVITTREVLDAFYATPLTYTSAFTFMEQTGFDGHRLVGVQEIVSKAAIIYAVRHGGVWTSIGSVHAVAMIAANVTTVVIVNDGQIWTLAWSEWIQMGGPGNEYWWFKWATP